VVRKDRLLEEEEVKGKVFIYIVISNCQEIMRFQKGGELCFTTDHMPEQDGER